MGDTYTVVEIDITEILNRAYNSGPQKNKLELLNEKNKKVEFIIEKSCIPRLMILRWNIAIAGTNPNLNDFINLKDIKKSDPKYKSIEEERTSLWRQLQSAADWQPALAAILVLDQEGRKKAQDWDAIAMSIEKEFSKRHKAAVEKTRDVLVEKKIDFPKNAFIQSMKTCAKSAGWANKASLIANAWRAGGLYWNKDETIDRATKLMSTLKTIKTKQEALFLISTAMLKITKDEKKEIGKLKKDTEHEQEQIERFKLIAKSDMAKKFYELIATKDTIIKIINVLKAEKEELEKSIEPSLDAQKKFAASIHKMEQDKSLDDESLKELKFQKSQFEKDAEVIDKTLEGLILLNEQITELQKDDDFSDFNLDTKEINLDDFQEKLIKHAMGQEKVKKIIENQDKVLKIVNNLKTEFAQFKK